MQPINPFEWMQHYYVFEYAIIITLSIFLISMLLMAIKAVQGALYLKPTSAPCESAMETKEDNEADLYETIKAIVQESLRIKEFDTAMVLMEKQRLIKLQIEELKLRLELQSTTVQTTDKEEQPL